MEGPGCCLARLNQRLTDPEQAAKTQYFCLTFNSLPCPTGFRYGFRLLHQRMHRKGSDVVSWLVTAERAERTRAVNQLAEEPPRNAKAAISSGPEGPRSEARP